MIDWATLPVAPSLTTWIQTGTVARNLAPPLPFALVGHRLVGGVAGSAPSSRVPLRGRCSAAVASEPRLSKAPAPAASQPEHTSADARSRPAVAGAAVTCERREDPGREHDQSLHLSPFVAWCKEPLHERRVSVAAGGADRPDRHAAAGRDVRDRARVERRGRRRPGRAAATTASPASARGRRSSATTSRRRRRSRISRRRRRCSATTRSRSRRSRRGCRRARTRRAPRSTARSTTCRGSSLGVPVWKLLGLPRTGPPTSWTVWLGDPDDMARRAEKAAARFRRLKLKLGGGDGLDVERVRAVRGVTELPLQVDVNEWWSLDEALDALPQLPSSASQYCEQPLAAGDEGGADAEGALADPDLRRRGLPPARQRRRLRRDRARDQHQAREVGRHPRGDPDGARRPRARARASCSAA